MSSRREYTRNAATSLGSLPPLVRGPGAAPRNSTGTLKNIKETGAITLGYRDSSIPFSYLDDNQKPIGYAAWTSATRSSMP